MAQHARRSAAVLAAGVVFGSGAAAAVAGPIVAGAGAGLSPNVRVIDPFGGTSSFMAYGPSFTGGVRVATGDINGDGVADIVTGAGAGGLAQVKVFSGTDYSEIRSFDAYGGFTGGVYVAAGDVDGDGFADVITGAGAGGLSHVKVFSGQTGGLLRSYNAFEPTFAGGVRVAAGDVNGDGRADVITGAGAGGGGHVRVFDGVNDGVLRSFFAYGAGFMGGVFVAAGDLDGDGVADLVTGPDEGAGPHVRVFDGLTLEMDASFFAYDTQFLGGVRVGVGDVDGDGFADVITGSGPGGGAHVKVFQGAGGPEIASLFAFPGSGDVYVSGVIPGPGVMVVAVMAGGVIGGRRRRR